jgi:hypothetical protein
MITGPNEVILSPEEWALHNEVIEAAREVREAYNRLTPEDLDTAMMRLGIGLTQLDQED